MQPAGKSARVFVTTIAYSEIITARGRGERVCKRVLSQRVGDDETVCALFLCQDNKNAHS